MLPSEYTDWAADSYDWSSIPGMGRDTSLFAIASRPALEPKEPPMKLVQGSVSPGIKRLGREADHSSPSSAEVKNRCSYTSTPPYVFVMRCLIKVICSCAQLSTTSSRRIGGV
jgi:hypothetical protein